MTEKAPAPPPGFPAGLPPSPGLATGYPARKPDSASQPSTAAAGVAAPPRPRNEQPSPFAATPPSRNPDQSPFAQPSPARPGAAPGPAPQSPFAQSSAHASPFTAPPGTALPPPSPSPFAPAFGSPSVQETAAAAQHSAPVFDEALFLRARPRTAGPLYAQRPAPSLRPMPFTPLVAQPSNLTGPPAAPFAPKASGKGPLIAGSLVVVAVISLVAMFVFSSSSDKGQPANNASPFGNHTVEELASFLPTTAPDEWTIASQQAIGSTSLVDGLGPDNGSNPVDPSVSTNPAGCANPLKPDSVAWAATVRFRSNAINTITSLPDSTVVMVGVQRSKEDPVAEYRASLTSTCLNYTYTNPQTSASVAVRQEIIGNKSFPNADSSLGARVSQEEDGKRGLLNWVTIALKHDVVVKTMASEYYGSDLANNSMSTVLDKIAQPAPAAPK